MTDVDPRSHHRLISSLTNRPFHQRLHRQTPPLYPSSCVCPPLSPRHCSRCRHQHSSLHASPCYPLDLQQASWSPSPSKAPFSVDCARDDRIQAVELNQHQHLDCWTPPSLHSPHSFWLIFLKMVSAEWTFDASSFSASHSALCNHRPWEGRDHQVTHSPTAPRLQIMTALILNQSPPDFQSPPPLVCDPLQPFQSSTPPNQLLDFSLIDRGLSDRRRASSPRHHPQIQITSSAARPR